MSFTHSEKNQGGLFNGNNENSIYLQFIPGIVTSVITNTSHKDSNNDSTNINSIMAKPHISNDIFNHHQNTSEKHRYKPLLRGVTDIPVKGEQVLLCNIGGTQYYFGPINTENNPNFNGDNMFKSQDSALGVFGTSNAPSTDNFVFNNAQSRLEKLFSPLDRKTSIDDEGSIIYLDPPNIRENYGDVLLEGRHGNSIRLGSRRSNPHIYISNGRGPSAPIESLGDASTISMTTFGSLLDHFPYFTQTKEADNFGFRSSQYGFILGSDMPLPSKDKLKQPIRTMSKMMDLIENITPNKDVTSSDYQEPQMLLNSNRIVINAKKDNIHISANKNMHIGASRFLSISTGGDLIIESRNIFLGKQAAIKYHERDSDKRNDNPPEPMVLGQQLVDILSELIDTLANSSYINAVGLPQLVHGSVPSIPGNPDKITGGGLYKPSGYIPSSDVNPNPPNPFKSLEDIQNSLEKIKSNYHFIESNVKNKKLIIKK